MSENRRSRGHRRQSVETLVKLYRKLREVHPEAELNRDMAAFTRDFYRINKDNFKKPGFNKYVEDRRNLYITMRLEMKYGNPFLDLSSD